MIQFGEGTVLKLPDWMIQFGVGTVKATRLDDIVTVLKLPDYVMQIL